MSLLFIELADSNEQSSFHSSSAWGFIMLRFRKHLLAWLNHVTLGVCQ